MAPEQTPPSWRDKISLVYKIAVSFAALVASCATAYQGWQAHSAANDATEALKKAKEAADGVKKIGDAVQGLAETNRQQMSLTLRAYETVTPRDLPNLIADRNLDLSVEFKNVGATPAHDVHISGAHRIQSASEIVPVSPSDFHLFSGENNIKTQEKDQVSKVSKESFVLTKSDYNRLSGGDFLVLFGQLDYDDVFGFHHYSRFCRMYSVNFPHPSDCSKWNEAM